MEVLNLLHPITNYQKSNCKHMLESYSITLKNKNSIPTTNTTYIATIQLLDFKTKFANRYIENCLKKNHVIIIFIRINQSQIIMNGYHVNYT
jgi:hypothetical protein